MNPTQPGPFLSRSQLLRLLQTALVTGEARYARRLALDWLSTYPGDLPVSFLHAKALIEEGHPRQAVPVLETICRADPEYLEAQEMLTTARKQSGLEAAADSASCVHALGGNLPPEGTAPEWTTHLRSARQAKSIGCLERANELVHKALPANPNSPLTAVTHLHVVAAQQDTSPLAIRSLAETYHDRWPDCLPITLTLAEALMDTGEADRAVTYLHQSAAQDVTGQVAERMWGSDHPYRNLWPEQLAISHTIPIPAGVAGMLGWNQLPSSVIERPSPESNEQITEHGDPPTQPTTRHQRKNPQASPRTPHDPEALKDIRSDLARLASHLKQPQLANADGRFPVFVIFSTRTGLEVQYGPGAILIEAEMKRLAQATLIKGRRGAILFYGDEGLYGVQPAKPNDPWALKLALADLEVALGKQGERIAAVLIVGGPEVVPFHHLPNPVDDADTDVPSDNPYATRDENYFIPEWPVGRLPGGAGKDPTTLVNALKTITTRRTEKKYHKRWIARWLEAIRGFFGKHPNLRLPSLGYTAAIWRRASLAVFRPIGDGRSLLVSPPVQTVSNGQWAVQSLGYFNLHGLVDAVEWYGQRDPTEPDNGPDYPVALRPQDIVNGGHAPRVVFSEACYGTHILGRTVEEALSLKFLASGSQGIVGSTCTSYGSITMPLIAADLLGRAFWNYLKDGLPTGEALRRAKIYLAREMHNRQGYLDGEDQKTLISFVLYGDPLAQPVDHPRTAKVLYQPDSHLQPKTICDRYEATQIPTPIPLEMLAHVKGIVARYLPGMSDAKLTYSHERSECHATGHTCPTGQLGVKSRPFLSPERQVVVLSKQIEQASLKHSQYARLTLDAKGKLVKLAVSR
jgi:hypothetical protein